MSCATMETSIQWGKWQVVMAGRCQVCEVEQMGVSDSHVDILSEQLQELRFYNSITDT